MLVKNFLRVKSFVKSIEITTKTLLDVINIGGHRKPTKTRRGYREYGKFQEESDNETGSDNDKYLVVKINDDYLVISLL